MRNAAIGFCLACLIAVLIFVNEAPAQSDNFAGMTSLEAPAQRAISITASDSVNLNFVCRGVYVGGAGDVAAVMTSGDVVTFAGATAGSVLPLRVKRINSTNTTATSLVCIW